MAEHFLIVLFYTAAFIGLTITAFIIMTICDSISDRRVKNKSVEDKPLGESVRQIKIKPQRPAYIEMIKNEYADEVEPMSKSQRIKVGI